MSQTPFKSVSSSSSNRSETSLSQIVQADEQRAVTSSPLPASQEKVATEIQPPQPEQTDHASLQKVPLRLVLVVPFVIQIMVAVGLTGWLSWRNGQQAVNDIANQLRSEISVRVEREITDLLEESEVVNKVNIDNLNRRQWSLQDLKSQERQVWNLLKLFYPSVNVVTISTSQGTHRSAELYQEGNPDILTADRIGGDFRIYASDERGNPTRLLDTTENYDVKARPFYTAAENAGKEVWSPIFPYTAAQHLLIFLAQPIYNDAGNLIGVTSAGRSLSDISELLNSFNVSQSGEVFVMERSGLLVANSTPESPLATGGTGEVQRLKATDSNSELIRLTAQYLSDRPGGLTGISSTQQLNFSIDGRQQFVQITPLQDNKGLDWLIVTVIPEADFLAQINANARTTILLCLAALVLAILSGLYTSRWISRPILRLNQASKAIAAGDLEQQVEVTGIDELEQLSQSFNRMASQLNQSFSTLEQTNTALEQANDELERRVEERTTELKQAKETSDGVNRTLQQRVIELLQEVDPISKGDLTVRAKVTADEIGTIADSYNATVENLRKIVVQVQQAANQMANTTSNSQASVQELSEEALRQAEAIASALQVIQDMAKAVQDVSMNAKQAEVAMQQATLTVEAGDVAMNRTVEGMQAIRATVAETAKKVKHLGESSQKISSVIELISAFAEQTKLLSLNASIEAALAGEEGRGFGMVANEVRALARRSAEATEEIRKLVMEIQAETNEVVAAMESGTQQVVIGTQLVDETRQSLNQITAVSTQISQLVEGIAQATIVQSQASEIVSQMMQDVVAIASKTSVEANQVASSFEQLREVAETLQMGVGQFKV